MDHGTQTKRNSATPFIVEKRQSAVDIVLNKMKELILTGVLKPGELIPSENDLAREMSVSRGSVREAMKILASFGVVEIKRGDGTYIAKSINKEAFNPLLFSLVMENCNMESVMELREVIEVSVVKLIIKRADEADFAEVRQILEDMKNEIELGLMDSDRTFEYELRFHSALGRATHNPLVCKIYDFVMEFFSPKIKSTTGEVSTNDGRSTLRIHQRILDALLARDYQKAEAAIITSLDIWDQNMKV